LDSSMSRFLLTLVVRSGGCDEAKLLISALSDDVFALELLDAYSLDVCLQSNEYVRNGRILSYLAIRRCCMCKERSLNAITKLYPEEVSCAGPNVFPTSNAKSQSASSCCQLQIKIRVVTIK
jgi:hypothetical protein